MATATVTYTRASIYRLLLNNQEALEKAILALQARQTADEQVQLVTRHQNGMGWNAMDAQRGGSLAQWIETGTTRYRKRVGTTLTPKQRVMALRMIRKYTGQLLAVAESKGACVDFDNEDEMDPPPGGSNRPAPVAPPMGDDDMGFADGEF